MIRSDLAGVPPYVPGKKPPHALVVASNETTQGPLPSVAQAIADAAGAVNRYPDMSVTALRAAIAAWFAKSAEGLRIDMDNIATGNGSTALCQQAIQATCHDGDEVLFAWRSFEAYPILSQVAGAKPVMVPLTEDHRHDFPAMLKAITDRTRLIFVCNPNNPSGTVMTHAEVLDFLHQVPQRITVILDEAYMEYDRSPEAVNAAEILRLFPNVAVCRTFSKAYGLAGLRLGYMVGGAEFIMAVNKVALPFGVNALAQAAGLASIDATDDELKDRVDATVTQRERLLQAVPEELRIPSQGNFILLPLGAQAEAVDAELKKEGVVARCFPGEGVRITATTAEETDKVIAALTPALATVGGARWGGRPQES
ncbi:histidinol-phosphate transaminase [Corynebacterium heidelbergense]|uniref:Aromatic amino acid aminotransferase n=1 Tax=Corynebacterium heidelbergense TaxID=2055947 RepID=A0A364VCW7_9CORY|nr:histidinol-phosphate transaminase [Corynebacterium heidelbergense]RAV34448.1 aminotransferase [Corynebacterium heidelbergense]WCZ37553.1 Putative phenylalanine aminotransferase [Corynebacterium heidelbergense]